MRKSLLRIALLHGCSSRACRRAAEVQYTVDVASIDTREEDRAAFTAETKINRKDFGVSWNRALDTGGFVVGEDVTIQIEVEATRKK